MKKQLRICEKCNAEIEPNQNFCPVCGAKVEPKKHSKKTKVTVAGAAVFVAVASITAALVLVPAIKKQNAYKEAVSCYTNGQYEQAQEQFESLGDYKDCKQKAIDACIGRAEQFLNEQDFDNAREILKTVEKSDTVKNMENQCDYKEAEMLVKKEEYAKADALYTKLVKKRYKDADKLEKEVRPKAADQLYENLLREQWEKISDEYQEVQYIVNDFNEDGINEIIICLTGGECRAYRYSEKMCKVEEIGKLYFVISEVIYSKKEHMLYLCDRNSEAGSYFFFYQYKDGKFVDVTKKKKNAEIDWDGQRLQTIKYTPGQRGSE